MRRRMGSLVSCLLVGVLLPAGGVPALAQDARGELLFGMSTALEGPAADLGRGMKRGVETAFWAANEAGGVNGRRLRLLALDDGYEPSRCAPNMRRLIEEDRVFAIIGNVGTPTAVVSVPIANEQKTLLFGCFTGAGVLRREPPDRYVINYRASYSEETGAMVDALIGTLGIKVEEIAFFTQNDAYGDAGFFGGVAALKRHGLRNENTVAHGRYPRNTNEVEQGLSVILESAVEPRAVIMVGAYAPCAKFIRMAARDLPQAIYLNVSFVGSNYLARDLGKPSSDDEGEPVDGSKVKVVVTQVVPHPKGDSRAAVEYRDLLARRKDPAPAGFVDFEGYLAAKLLIEGLRRAGSDPTKEKHIDALEAVRDFDLGIGVPVGFTRSDHQASHRTWPTVLRGGDFVELTDWATLKR